MNDTQVMIKIDGIKLFAEFNKHKFIEDNFGLDAVYGTEENQVDDDTILCKVADLVAHYGDWYIQPL